MGHFPYESGKRETLERFNEHFWKFAGDIPCFELENLFPIMSRNVSII